MTPLATSVPTSTSQRVADLQSLYNRIRAVQPGFTSKAIDGLLVAPLPVADGKLPDIYSILQFSAQQKELVEQTVSFIEFVSKAVSTVTAGINFADEALKLLGLVPSPEDQFAKLFDALKAEIQKVQDTEVESSYLSTMGLIDSSLAKARSAAQAVSVWVQQGKPMDNGVIYASALQADTDSREAVNELMTNSRWLGLFDRQLYLTAEKDMQARGNVGMGPWTIYASSHPFDVKHMFAGADMERMSDLVPREQGNYVWDCRLPLPAFLFAVSARLTVLQGHFPDFGTINQIYLDEINSIASFLATVAQKMADGIWTMPQDQWSQYVGLGPACCHYCCDVYTGQCVGNDKIQDMNFLLANWGNNGLVGQFILSRYLSLLDVNHTPVLSALASLAEISKAKTDNSAQPLIVPPQKRKIDPRDGLHPILDTQHAVNDHSPFLDVNKLHLFPKK